MSIAVGYWTLLDIFPRFVGLEPATADDSIFMLDSSKNRMFITSVKIFSKKITLNEYKVCFERALEKEKKLKKYLIRLFGKFFWVVDKNFDLNKHIFVYNQNANKKSLEAVVNGLLTKEFKINQPPYEIHFFKSYEKNASAIVFRFHHCLADGLSAISMIVSCSDPLKTREFYSPSITSKWKKLFLYFFSILLSPYLLLKIINQKTNKNALHGKPLSGTKSMSWTKNLNLKQILSYCKQQKITFNDFLTGIVLESLETYSSTKLGSLAAHIPISFRGHSNNNISLSLGNNVTIVSVTFPSVTKNIINDCSKEYKKLKSSLVPFIMHVMTKIGGNFVPAFVVKFFFQFFASKATFVFSNVAGPKDWIFYSGKRIESFIAMTPGGGNCGVSIAALSYADCFVITCYVDKALVSSPGRLVHIIEKCIARYEKKL